jgi:stage III sporulation protein SpoIIIAA
MNDLERLLTVLPSRLASLIEDSSLIEIVMDVGKPFELRYPDRFIRFSDVIVTEGDITQVAGSVSAFGPDNRAGIDGTLHRISRIVSRNGRTIGLTCRVGRPFFGCIDIIQDLIESGASVLLLGKPGVGKTTKLRDVARTLSTTTERRVVIVDTSNEIAGDGDTPHVAVGNARRLQVPFDKKQAEVMVEAVENHMPEVVIVDEISTREEAWAARTISQRGVQLIATAHGREFTDLLKNPPLWTLLGGLQTVTLSDSQAKQRGCSKTIQEREMEPVFDIVVELDGFDRAVIYVDTAATVEATLRGNRVRPEVRVFQDDAVLVTSGFKIITPVVTPPAGDEPHQKSRSDTSSRKRRR